MLRKITVFSLCLALGYLTPAFSYYCNEPCTKYYVGVDGGVVWALKKGHGNRTGGQFFTGSSDHLRRKVTGIIGANAGLFLNDCFRADISYAYSHWHTNWLTQFPGDSPDVFPSKLNTQLVLANLYVHLNPELICQMGGFNPYFGGGLGVAFNKLYGIIERSTDDNFFDFVHSHTHKNLAGKFQVGVLREICNWIALDLAFSATYLGKVSSGNRRTFVSGASQRIGRYSFTNNWTGAVTLGAKFFF